METFSNASDICQQLLDRYGNSAASQHRHLCATAAATRSIIQSESLPLTPLSYFAATISTLSDQSRLDPDAFAAVSSFLSILLPLVPEKAISRDKAKEAVEVVVERVNSDVNEVSLGTAGVRALVKSLGVLVGFCDVEDWDSVKLGFNTLLNFSIDKRPKVRKCAQDCILAVCKSFKSSAVVKKASKSVYSLLEDHMPLAIKISSLKAADGSKDDFMSKPEFQEVLYVLNVLKSILPHISVKICSKVLSQMVKLLNSESSALSRHIFEIIQVIFETSSVVITLDAEKIVKSLVSYMALKENNPEDSILFAASLSKHVIDKLHASEMTDWVDHLPSVIDSVAGLLSSKTSTALQASNILKDLINSHINEKFVLAAIQGREEDDKDISSTERRTVKSICGVFDNLLTVQLGVPNEHFLQVISVLFSRLGEVSDFYMKSILLKLAEVMTLSSSGASDTKHLQMCIGSAVIAMGPKKLLALLPISLNTNDLSCSNTWLIPIFKEYIVGSSLGFFMEYFVTLADSLRQESHKVEKSEIGQDLDAYAYNCWELLPAFCRIPTDTHQNFGALAKLLVPCIKDSAMFDTIAVALQELVDENKKVLASDELAGAKLLKTENLAIELKSRQCYSKKVASKNIRALASCSQELLQALIDVFFELPIDTHGSLKDAIGCLASIADPSVTKKIFISSLERFELIKYLGDSGDEEFQINSSVYNNETNATSGEKDAERQFRQQSSIIISIHTVGHYSWGSAVLATLYRSICDATSPTARNICGPVLLLQLWAWEHMLTLRRNQLEPAQQHHGSRCLVLKLASSFVDGASEELINLLFKVTRNALEVTEGIGQPEAYQTLSRILEKHPSFCSSQCSVVLDFLLNLKSPSNINSLRSRFTCLRTLLIHAVKENLDEENPKAFIVLNEIIVALKDSTEEGRKAAYDVLIEISTSLRNTSFATSDGLYQKLITMIMAYLMGSSPHIKSGAVSALSVLVYNDTDICLSIPDLIPSILSLLQNKAVEVIKAVLGFVKVLVSSLQANDLQTFLPDIVNGILPWSSMSRHHFRSKVTVILEIMVRKCGTGAIKSLASPKYRAFLQNVLENRRGKTSSKETGTPETESKRSDLSQRRWRKRKHEESTILPKEEGSTGSSKRPREKIHKGASAKESYKSSSFINRQKLVNRKGDPNHDVQKARQSHWQKDKKGSFMKGQSGGKGKGKRKRNWLETAKKNGDTNKPADKLAKL